MATNRTTYDESLVERDEVLFPNTDVIDTEPHYDNFTTIQNALRQRDGEQQMHQVSSYYSILTADQGRAYSSRFIQLVINIERFALSSTRIPYAMLGRMKGCMRMLHRHGIMSPFQ